VRLDGKVVMVTDFGKSVITDKVLEAYGVLKKPKSNDRRRREVKDYYRSLRTLEHNCMSIASHEFIMGRDASVIK